MKIDQLKAIAAARGPIFRPDEPLRKYDGEMHIADWNYMDMVDVYIDRLLAVAEAAKLVANSYTTIQSEEVRALHEAIETLERE